MATKYRMLGDDAGGWSQGDDFIPLEDVLSDWQKMWEVGKSYWNEEQNNIRIQQWEPWESGRFRDSERMRSSEALKLWKLVVEEQRIPGQFWTRAGQVVYHHVAYQVECCARDINLSRTLASTYR